MSSQLDNLCGPNKPLAPEPPDAAEFAGLKRSGLARLQDAGNTGLSLEGRFDLAYNAAHALSLAALRWHGYRAGNRYIVFQVLPHTLSFVGCGELANRINRERCGSFVTASYVLNHVGEISVAHCTE